MVTIRKKLFNKILKLTKYVEGSYLNKFQMIIRCILFPLSSFYWYMHKQNGYCPATQSWKINGVRYSNQFFEELAVSKDGNFPIIRKENGYITINHHCVYCHSLLTKHHHLANQLLIK